MLGALVRPIEHCFYLLAARGVPGEIPELHCGAQSAVTIIVALGDAIVDGVIGLPLPAPRHQPPDPPVMFTHVCLLPAVSAGPGSAPRSSPSGRGRWRRATGRIRSCRPGRALRL